MMEDRALRLTTVAYDAIARRLDISDPSELDHALADAGYVRLDLGDVATGSVVIMATRRFSHGRDPGHRAAASRAMRVLMHVAHAEGPPRSDRVMLCMDAAADLVDTDEIGLMIVQAIAAYHADRDPGAASVPATASGERRDLLAWARAVHSVARYRGVITDVAIMRAMHVGEEVEGWEEAFRSRMDPAEPIRTSRRHEAADYSAIGVGPQISEIIAWLRANPDATTDEYRRTALLTGVDPTETAHVIRDVLTGLASKRYTIGGPSSTSTNSSSGSEGPAGSGSGESGR